jgi:hypothetical protein
MLNPPPTEEWCEENDCAAATIMEDWKARKGACESGKRNRYLLVPDELITTVKWIRFGTSYSPAGSLIVTYIVSG